MLNRMLVSHAGHFSQSIYLWLWRKRPFKMRHVAHTNKMSFFSFVCFAIFEATKKYFFLKRQIKTQVRKTDAQKIT